MALALGGNINRRTYNNVKSRFMSTESASSKRGMTGQAPVAGLYWTPKDHDPEVALMLVHYAADFSEHYICAPMASHGYGVLGLGTRYRAMEELFMLDLALDDIAAGIEWLIQNTNTKKLVFIASSGGGSLMSAFLAKAQSDAGVSRAADAFIFLNAHPGRADILTDWLDPSVIDEADPAKRDASLDMYNPANGPPYSPDFQARYRDAQKQRNHRISAWARQELQRLNAAGISDRIFSVDGTQADLRFLDGSIDPSDRPVPACYQGDPQTANHGVGFLARAVTLKTWLSMFSLADSRSRFGHLAPAITVPALVVQSRGDVGVFPSMAREIYAQIASEPKELRFVAGAHCFENRQEDLDAVVEILVEWTEKTVVVVR